jgi:hypothetical protein
MSLHRVQKLLEEELALSNDLKNLEKKYDDWSQAVDQSLLKPPVRSISKTYISNTDNTREVSCKAFSFNCHHNHSRHFFRHNNYRSHSSEPSDVRSS